MKVWVQEPVRTMAIRVGPPILYTKHQMQIMLGSVWAVLWTQQRLSIIYKQEVQQNASSEKCAVTKAANPGLQLVFQEATAYGR